MLSALFTQKFALLHSKIHGKTSVWESSFILINVIINNNCWTKNHKLLLKQKDICWEKVTNCL